MNEITKIGGFKNDLPYCELVALLEYSPISGDFWWKNNRGRIKAGALAGKTDKGGYKYIKINYKHRAAGRVAWTMYYGENPNGEIDHIDGNPSNNKISNLRTVSRKQNVMNRRSKGVRRCSDCRAERYSARIKIDGKEIGLGRFDTYAKAKEARKKAEIKYFGEYRRV